MFPVPKGSLITSANCFILSSTLLCHSSIPPHSTLSLTLYFFLPLSLFSLSLFCSLFSLSLYFSLSLSLSSLSLSIPPFLSLSPLPLLSFSLYPSLSVSLSSATFLFLPPSLSLSLCLYVWSVVSYFSPRSLQMNINDEVINTCLLCMCLLLQCATCVCVCVCACVCVCVCVCV